MSSKTSEEREREATMALARDEFSEAWRNGNNNPGAVAKQSTIDVTDFYGNLVTWVVRTVRVEGQDTVFLQRNGERMVLPPKVTEALARQRDGASTVNRKRGAQAGVATRKALGIVPGFLRKKGVA